MLIDRYQGRLIILLNHHQHPLLSRACSENMPPAKLINLSDYKSILIAHEREYRGSQGDERQAVIRDVMEEIVAQSKGSLSKDTMKGLSQVSQLIEMCNLDMMLIQTQKIHT
jgi:hypothetical protein